MKVIFLDIDGVINSVRSATAFGNYPHNVDKNNIKLFDNIAIALIRKVCDTTNCKIVLSSTWRRFINYKKFSKAFDLPIISITPPSKLTSTRGEEIAMWLRNNKVHKYAIIDDDSDMLKEQLKCFVKTDRFNGLSYENYLKLLDILK